MITFDPGKNTGWATFWKGRLVGCGILECDIDNLKSFIIKAADVYARHTDTSLTVMEYPQVYTSQNVRQSDVVDLAFIDGVLAGEATHRGHDILRVTPATWKGQMPKKAHHAMIMDNLELKELQFANVSLQKYKQSIKHNALDAIGLGLWKLRRIK